MSTKVFISWSGDLSRKLAEAVHQWLPSVLQYVKPYFTPDDVEKGTKWSTEISSELKASGIGIICLTKNNLKNPWILFEAGALSRNFEKSKVCTLLFGLESSDLAGPLTGFQDTKFNKKDFKRLIESINNESGDSKLESKVLDEVFDVFWERLEKKVNIILKDHHSEDDPPTRSDRDLIEEILDLSRMRSNELTRSVTTMGKKALKDLLHLIIRYSKYESIDSKTLLSHLKSPLTYLCHQYNLLDELEQITQIMDDILSSSELEEL